ncbi:MAG: hypothetical protein OHK0052_06130 [Anaerolineales bacterium]
MEILGIGLPELFFILLLVLVLINPKDMKTTGLTIGRSLRRVVTSPLWQELRNVWSGVTNLPYQLMRESQLEEDLQSIKQTGRELKNTIAPQAYDVPSWPYFSQKAASSSRQAAQSAQTPYGAWSPPSAPAAAAAPETTPTPPTPAE